MLHNHAPLQVVPQYLHAVLQMRRDPVAARDCPAESRGRRRLCRVRPTAGLVYVGGALGLELVSGLYVSARGQDVGCAASASSDSPPPVASLTRSSSSAGSYGLTR